MDHKQNRYHVFEYADRFALRASLESDLGGGTDRESGIRKSFSKQRIVLQPG